MYDIEQPKDIFKQYKNVDLIEKVAEYITICESDSDSYYHWNYLKKMYSTLAALPKENLTESYRDILKILEPFILKHSNSDGNQELDGLNMFKHLDNT